jgi:hypothetical protein
MTLRSAIVTVYFNETHGDRFTQYRPSSLMVPSVYFRDLDVLADITDPETEGREPIERAIAEWVFARGNADDRPNGNHERSISVGDVVVTTGYSYLSPRNAYAVEPIGLRRLGPDEWPPRPA